MIGTGRVERAARGRACEVPGCRRRHLARGYCRAHYLRWRRDGDADPDRPVATRGRGADDHRAALARVRTVRGRAAAHRCADCASRPAALWSYDGTDPHVDSAADHPYSLDPTRYRPRCRSCHRRACARGGTPDPFDVARAVRLYRAGASSTGIAAVLGVSPSTVLRALRARGVTVHGRRPDPRRRRDDSRNLFAPQNPDATAP